MSFDFKLFFVYHISMMVLFAARPIDEPTNQAFCALGVGVILFALSIAHKIKRQWSWPGLRLYRVILVVFNVAFFYFFFAFSAYTMNSQVRMPNIEAMPVTNLLQESWVVITQAFNQPVFTPWFLAGVGMVIFSIMTSFNLVTLKKDEFEAQCRAS